MGLREARGYGPDGQLRWESKDVETWAHAFGPRLLAFSDPSTLVEYDQFTGNELRRWTITGDVDGSFNAPFVAAAGADWILVYHPTGGPEGAWLEVLR